MLGLGLGLGLTARGGGASNHPAAPTIAYVTPITNPPDFTATLVDPLEGDVLRLQLSTDQTFVTVDYTFTHTVDASDVADEGASISTSGVSGGDYYARLRVERSGSGNSAWSSIIGSFTVPNAQLFLDDFSTDTSASYTGTNATVSVTGGRLRVTNSGSLFGRAQRQLLSNLTVGKDYTLSCDIFTGTTSNPKLSVGSTNGGTDYANATLTAGLGKSVTFTAISAGLYIKYDLNDNVSGHYAELDNLRVETA